MASNDHSRPCPTNDPHGRVEVDLPPARPQPPRNAGPTPAELEAYLNPRPDRSAAESSRVIVRDRR
jgi:hypothetical protein